MLLEAGVKRLRPEDLLDLLDDDADAAAAGDLASIMQSLEEEIGSFDEVAAGGGAPIGAGVPARGLRRRARAAAGRRRRL